jgi:Tfp pilus assembly PilM family ATPase
VDLSSFALVNLYRGVIDKEVPADGDFMIVNVTGSFFTVMIFRAGRVLFYRCKAFTTDDDASLEGRRRLLRREVQASLVYYQERLNGRELSRLYVRASGLDTQAALSALTGDGIPVAAELMEVRRALSLSGRINAAGDRADELLQKLAPAIGAAVGRAGRAA